jgi:hypothetical protein
MHPKLQVSIRYMRESMLTRKAADVKTAKKHSCHRPAQQTTNLPALEQGLELEKMIRHLVRLSSTHENDQALQGMIGHIGTQSPVAETPGAYTGKVSTPPPRSYKLGTPSRRESCFPECPGHTCSAPAAATPAAAQQLSPAYNTWDEVSPRRNSLS